MTFLARCPHPHNFGGETGHAHREVRLAKKRHEDLADSIERLALKLEAPLRDAILDMLALMAEAVDLKALERALQAGDLAAAAAVLDAVDLGEAAERAEDALRGIVWGAGALAATQINLKLRGVRFAFDKLNPELIRWLQGYRLGLVRELRREATEHVRGALVTGMARGQSPVATARAVREGIGLTTRQAQAIQNFRRKLETFHLRRSAKGWNLGAKISRTNGRQVFAIDDDGNPVDGILERRLRDFRMDGKLATALKTGKPLSPETIDKMVAAYHRKYLRHRSEVIARTEALRATNWGVQHAWDQAIQSGTVQASLVRRQWVVAKDERTCPTCAPIPRMNPKRGVPMDQPFKSPAGPVMLPPLHPNCRCTVFIRQWEPVQLAGE